MIVGAVQYFLQHVNAVPVQCGIAPVNVLENVLEKGEVEMECSLQCQLKHRPQVDAQQCRVTWREKVYRWRQLRRERYALRHLSDHMLQDIGISREAVQRESNRPFWDDRGWHR